VPIKLHAKLMTLAVKVRRVAVEEEQDRSRREAMAEAALKWADRVLSVLPGNPEACWYLDYHQLWLVRLQCLLAERPASRSARCPMHRPRLPLSISPKASSTGSCCRSIPAGTATRARWSATFASGYRAEQVGGVGKGASRAVSTTIRTLRERWARFSLWPPYKKNGA
jgi:hypothetical protein